MSDKEKRRLVVNLAAKALLVESFFVKAKAFSHEEEFRIIIFSDKKEFRTKDQKLMIPFTRVSFTNLSSVEEITIASLNKSDLAKKGLVEYLTSIDGSHIKVKSSGISLRHK